jgi:phosphate transport system permease protein
MASSNPPLPPSTIPPRHRIPKTPGGGWGESLIEFFLFSCGMLSIVITVAIAFVVLYGAINFFLDPSVSIWYFLTGLEWSAGFANPKYGIPTLFVGTVMVAVIAALVAIPLGLTTAIYLSEYASPRMRAFIKPTLELLAGIPTVVYGFFALTTVTPFLAAIGIPVNQPYNQLAGGIVVGIMILPMVASLSEDALRAVPRSLREGSYALGATEFETSMKVVVPAALSGILASFLLAISRAIGETMAVTLACGAKRQFTINPMDGVATMTSFIAQVAQGEVVVGSTTYNSLFAVAAVLFFMTLAMNVLAQWILRRYRMVYQ